MVADGFDAVSAVGSSRCPSTAADTAASRVNAVLSRSAFVGEAVVADRVRVRVSTTTGLPNPEGAALPAGPLPSCLRPAAMPPGPRFEYRNGDTLVPSALLAQVSGRP